MAVAHYLEALAWQREVVQIHTIFGGKNPHPNFLVGGAPSPISVASGGAAATAVNMAGLERVKTVIRRMQEFVDQVYVPDTLAIASFYKDWFARGEGVGNFLTYGDFPEKGMDDPSSWLIPAGVILDRDLSTIHPIDMNDPEARSRNSSSHSWYDYAGGKDAGLHPYKGETNLHYTGPKPPFTQLDVDRRLFLAEVAALERQGDGGRPARARADALCQRPRADARTGDLCAWASSTCR